MSAQAAWRHCPSKAGSLVQVMPMAWAFVSVTRNGACLVPYMRSAWVIRDHTPEVVQDWPCSAVLGSARASCMR
ncbi:hypothetical protein GCM10009793_24670 [Brachybacterium phenoliresistens]